MTIEVAPRKLSLYFGYVRGSGHFLCDQRGAIYDAAKRYPSFPWTDQLLDTGLLKNRKVPDSPDGRVHWVCGGTPLWLAFVWWDRSGDARGDSNSGFYVQGFSHLELREAFDFACSQWPEVVARQRYPLILQEDIGAHLKMRAP